MNRHGRKYRAIIRYKDDHENKFETIIITFDSTKYDTPQGQAWFFAHIHHGNKLRAVTVTGETNIKGASGNVFINLKRKLHVPIR